MDYKRGGSVTSYSLLLRYESIHDSVTILYYFYIVFPTSHPAYYFSHRLQHLASPVTYVLSLVSGIASAYLLNLVSSVASYEYFLPWIATAILRPTDAYRHAIIMHVIVMSYVCIDSSIDYPLGLGLYLPLG